MDTVAIGALVGVGLSLAIVLFLIAKGIQLMNSDKQDDDN